jgi:hypothetical protein
MRLTDWIGTTYVAGCTDPTYQDPSCPNKGIYNNQQWSGLVYCNGTSDEWTLCDDSSVAGNGGNVVPVPGCYCPDNPDSGIVAFSAGNPIGNQVSLPAATGESMSLFPGYTPGTVLASSAAPTTSSSSTPPPPKTTSAKPTSTKPTSTQASLLQSTSSSSPSSSSASSDSSSTISSTSMSTSTAAQSSSSSSATVAPVNGTITGSSGLSTGAKAGIGIGAAILGLGIIALLAFLAICLRRRKQRAMLSEGPSNPHTSEVQPMPTPMPMPQQQYQPSTEYPNRYSPAWSSAAKSELPGSDTTNTSPSIPQSWGSRPLSEAEGTNFPTYQSMASLRTSELSGGGAYRSSPQYHAGTSSTSQGSYRPGKPMQGSEGGMYEMPANLPGSTMM